MRVALTLNLIDCDGQTNVLQQNTLDFERWIEKIQNDDWLATYGPEWNKMRKLRKIRNETNENLPMLIKYELHSNVVGKTQTKVGRDILFIERNLDFQIPCRRLTIVLPQLRFNNSSDKICLRKNNYHNTR